MPSINKLCAYCCERTPSWKKLNFSFQLELLWLATLMKWFQHAWFHHLFWRTTLSAHAAVMEFLVWNKLTPQGEKMTEKNCFNFSFFFFYQNETFTVLLCKVDSCSVVCKHLSGKAGCLRMQCCSSPSLFSRVKQHNGNTYNRWNLFFLREKTQFVHLYTTTGTDQFNAPPPQWYLVIIFFFYLWNFIISVLQVEVTRGGGNHARIAVLMAISVMCLKILKKKKKICKKKKGGVLQASRTSLV